MKRPLVLGLDAGSATVVAAVAEVVASEPHVIGVGVAPNTGMRRGMVVDLTATAAAMQEAIAQAERNAHRSLEGVRAVLSVSGPHVMSVVGRAEANVLEPTTGVTEADVETALNMAASVELPPGRQVIHVVPRAYRLDGADGVMDPVGLAGRQLAAEAHLITVDALPVQNYLRAAVKAGVQVADYQLGVYAAGEAVLTPEEREAGTLLIDFGGGMTGFAIYASGRLWHVGMVPVGGEHITRDLASLLQVPMHVAERLKTERGWASVALCPDTSLELVASTGQKAREMQDQRLAQIIEPRVQETLHMVAEQVKASGYTGIFAGGLVLTGGGARLKGLAEVAGEWLGVGARIGAPRGAVIGGPELATAAGLCRWAAGLVQGEQGAGLPGPSASGPDLSVSIAADSNLSGSAAKQGQEKRGSAKSWLGSLFG